MTDITEQKVRLVKATFNSKLGKKISDEILMPILDQLEENIPTILTEAADWARDKIVDILVSSTPSGRSYGIYEYSTGEFKNLTEHELHPHQASAANQMPATMTGTLAESVSYEIYSDGYFRIGVLKEFGEESDEGTEFKSSFYSPRMKAILVNTDPSKLSSTPVGTYAKYLASGTKYMKRRPWFKRAMFEIKQELRDRIRKNVRTAFNKATRRISVRKAIVFKVYFME